MAHLLPPHAYLGEVKRIRVLDWLTLNECVYPPCFFIPSHEHSNPFFYLAVEGRFAETTNRLTLEVRPADLVFHPTGSIHSSRWSEHGGRLFHIEFDAGKMERLCETARMIDEVNRFPGGWPSQIAQRLYREYQQPDEFTPLALESLALEMLTETSRRVRVAIGSRAPRWLKRVRELLHDRMADRLSMDELAAEAGVHRSHLARTFRQYYGCSLGEYLRDVRLRWAVWELTSTDAPIAAIAAQAGFGDQSYFTRVFRKQFGQTPAQFRAGKGRATIV
jgi:AraC family transcriptional regulator